MTNDSTRRKSSGKARAPKASTPASTPKKPSKDFPLSIHKGSGYWCKKVKGRVHYFGKVADDPKGKAALELWLEQKDDLLAGRVPRAKRPDAVTIADLCNEYLTQQEERRDAGEISPRTFQGLHSTCATLVKVFGNGRAASDLTPADFAKLRKALAKTRGAVALRNEMQRCRSVFRFAFVNGLIDREVRYGTKFEKPPMKQVRRNKREQRQQHGARMFEAVELRRILAKANPQMRAMILLGINAGLGQSDLSGLSLDVLDLDGGWLDYPRPKTEASRLCPLWPETIAALREWLPQRPKAKNPADAKLVFLTARGQRWVKLNKNGTPADALGQEFSKLLTTLGIKRAGVSFYAIRHSFRTVADATLDPVAINLIMGHTDNSMAENYRERIGDDRLRRVVEHVRQWLFDTPDDSTGPDSIGADSIDPIDPSDPQDEQDGEHLLRLFVG